MKNRFIIVSPFYNAKGYIKECYQSVITQSYSNWLLLFGDDCSTDGTSLKIPDNDTRIIKKINKTRLTALLNTHELIMSIPDPDPEDIIVILDGDDKLYNDDVLDYLNNFYNENKSLVVYGQYMRSDGQKGWGREFKNIQEFKNVRNGGFFLSHIRSWKYKVYQELVLQDPSLSCYRNKYGNFFKTAADVAVMYPLVEIAGYDNIKFNPEILYYYRQHENNDCVINIHNQRDTEEEIKLKPKFKQIF